MKTLITGGTGFIGSRLAQYLMERGESVRILGLINNPVEEANAEAISRRGGEVVLGSIVDRDAVRRSVDGVGIVFHLAAAQHEANVPDSRFWEINVTGTENLLSESTSAEVSRFVHGSTIGVYGSRAGRTIIDDSPLLPTNIYGVTKLKAEEVVRSYRSQLDTVVIRISETYGPGDRRLLKLFRGIAKGHFFYIGSCTNLHHPIYIDDLLAGLEIAASDERAVGETMVLAGPVSVTTREMVEQIAAALRRRKPSLHLPLTPFFLIALLLEKTLGPVGIQPPLHRRRLDFFRTGFSFSNESPRTLLGFVPAIPLEKGIAETARWYIEAGLL